MIFPKIYYENSEGEKIDFSGFPIAIDGVENLIKKEWDLELAENRMKNRSRITSISRTQYQTELTLQVFADSEEEFAKIVDRFDDVTDYDAVNESLGKLWVGDYYMECILHKADTEEFEEQFYSTDIKIELTATNPFWLKEVQIQIYKQQIISEGEYLDYPYGYPYDYMVKFAEEKLYNEGHIGAEFEIIMYGKAVNPQVMIGENLYKVNCIVEEGEYLTINSNTRKIFVTKVNGETENVYMYREPRSNFFKAIKRGYNKIIWPGDFGMDIKLLHKRSIPKLWN